MFLRKVAIILLIVVVILGGITAYLTYDRDWRLFSDPAALRTNQDYERLMAVSKPSDLPEPKENPGMVIENLDTELTIREPGGLVTMAPIYPPSEIHRAAGTNAIQLGVGAISLRCIGVGYAAPKTNFDYVINIPAQFYTPDLKALSNPDLAGIFSAWTWNTNVEFRGQFPTAKFVFTRTNLTEFKFIGAQVFDARTRFNLMSSYSRSGDQDAFWSEGEISLWHQTPLELVLTVAIGPVETYTILPKTNETVRYPGGLLKLIGIVDGPVRGISSMHDGKTNRVTLRKQTAPLSQFDAQGAFVFLSLPGISDPPIDIEFLNEAGKTVGTRGGSSSLRINMISLAEPIDRVKQIRVKYYSKVARLIFQIPEFPGLPAENRNLKNLFDARIPYIRFQNDWEAVSGLGRLTQTGPPALISLNPTNTFYPLIFTNVTTRDLFLDLSKRLPNPEDRLTVDPIKNTIEVAHPPLAMLLEKLRNLMR
jgi:hypothetical protein